MQSACFIFGPPKKQQASLWARFWPKIVSHQVFMRVRYRESSDNFYLAVEWGIA